MYSVHSECWYITLHAGQCVRTHPDLPELHGGPQQHPVHLRGGLHPAAAPPSLRGVPGILVTSLNLSSPCYSPHLQSMRCGIPLSIIFYKKLMITCIIKAKVWLTEFCVLCVYKIFSQQPVNILLKSQKNKSFRKLNMISTKAIYLVAIF